MPRMKLVKTEMTALDQQAVEIIKSAERYVVNVNPLLKNKNIDEQAMQALLQNYVMMMNPKLKGEQVIHRAAAIERDLTEDYMASDEDVHYHAFVSAKVARKIAELIA